MRGGSGRPRRGCPGAPRRRRRAAGTLSSPVRIHKPVSNARAMRPENEAGPWRVIAASPRSRGSTLRHGRSRPRGRVPPRNAAQRYDGVQAGRGQGGRRTEAVGGDLMCVGLQKVLRSAAVRMLPPRSVLPAEMGVWRAPCAGAGVVTTGAAAALACACGALCCALGLTAATVRGVRARPVRGRRREATGSDWSIWIAASPPSRQCCGGVSSTLRRLAMLRALRGAHSASLCAGGCECNSVRETLHGRGCRRHRGYHCSMHAVLDTRVFVAPLDLRAATARQRRRAGTCLRRRDLCLLEDWLTLPLAGVSNARTPPRP